MGFAALNPSYELRASDEVVARMSEATSGANLAPTRMSLRSSGLRSYCMRAGAGIEKCSGAHVPHFKATLALHPSSRATHLRRHAFLLVVLMLLQASIHSPRAVSRQVHRARINTGVLWGGSTTSMATAIWSARARRSRITPRRRSRRRQNRVPDAVQRCTAEPGPTL